MAKEKVKRAASTGGEESVKVTFYISKKTVERLEKEWLQRRIKGDRKSKSQLVEDAINKLFGDLKGQDRDPN